ncbi:BRO-N domain-containing protein [Nostoc sp.]|uniref:BRO-N domain-containing protein n=1 Tax=Nostoc sp. TaxID=1180 RepID=UPI002FF4B688
MSNLTVFQFESHEVRFVGTAIDPWWVGADVCAALKHSNPSSAIARLDEDEKKLLDPKQYLGSSSNQEFWAISESGFYSLIFTSRKAQAKRFKKWVTSVVLPSIRKTGSYALASTETASSIVPTPESQVKSLQSSVPTPQEISDLFDLTLGGAGLDSKLIAGVKLNAIASYNPALLEAAEIAKSALSIPIEQGLVRPTQLGEKLEAKTGEKWSAIKVNKLLTDLGFQIPNPDGKNPAYLPTEKGSEYSQLVLDTAKGRDKTVQSLQWHLSVLEALEA